jgi:cellulose synthase/poly-beta-1,6-N-acetylglucosamine synthase-like glycosyltransferase
MLDKIILVLSLTVTISFFFYGYNCYYLLRASKKYSPPQLNKLYIRPTVAIHLPVYNEQYTVERLIDHCIEMAEEYGKEAVRIMVLDDSDDETSDILDTVVARYSNAGYNIEIIRRRERKGYKAGALQEALVKTNEEFIAIFDADFIPPRDFLIKTIPYFIQDEKVGIVQCRWSHINREYNLITKAVSIGIDAHFYVEQPGRYASGCLLNFNGSAGVIRRSALLEAGGWHIDTLAEDLDASYRLQLKGYKILYLNEPHVDGEVPPTLISFKRQQARWARGSMQTAKKILPKLLAHPKLNFKQKIQGVIHLTYYSVHLLMFFAFLLAITASLANATSISLPVIKELDLSRSDQFVASLSSLTIQQIAIILLSSTIIICAAASWVYYAATLRAQSLSLIKNAPNLLLLGLIGYGISISNTIEVLKAVLTKQQGEFKRTPKYAVKSKEDSWRDKKYHVPLDKKIFIEWASIIFGILSAYFAYKTENFGILPILTWYVVAYLFVNILTLIQCGREK